MSSFRSQAELSTWQRFWQSKTNQRRVVLGFKYVLAFFVLVYSLTPVLYTISSAFNPVQGLSRTLIPLNATLANFRTILLEYDFGLWILNTTKIAGVSSVLAALVTTLTAYAFSRYRFAGRSQLLLGILLIQVFPGLLAMIAIFSLVTQFGSIIPALGLDTHAGLIMVYLGGAMGVNIWLMKGFFDTIPRAIDESAMVDGATHWQIFSQLLLPLMRPILVVIGILSFIGTYGDFILARILLKSTEQYPLMVGLFIFTSGEFSQKWGPFAAGALIGALPIMIIYLILQDQIVGGLTQGAVKG